MPLRILHLHSTFSLGGKEARAVRLMNAFGDRAVHSIVSAMPDQLGARAAIAKGIGYEIAQTAPSLEGKPGVARYQALAAYMRRFDLVLTYNWGSMDAVMARRIFGGPPLIHHEDGFNADEAVRLKTERNLFRRLALPAAHALVVPSHRLEDIARRTWQQPASRLRRISNGIATRDYAGKPDIRAIPGLARRRDEVVIGTLAGLRVVKDLPRLVRAAAPLGERMQLVIVGEGPERATIVAEAARLGVAERVSMPGFLPGPHRYVGMFDIFALASKSEQFPISVVEAMAAGLPVVAPDVGDLRRMVATANLPLIAPRDDEQALAASFETLAGDRALREAIGAENRAKARAEFDEAGMIAAYAALYAGAVGRTGALG